MPGEKCERWSDKELEQFYAEFKQHVIEFKQHVVDEGKELVQQRELHEAIFQKEDKEANVPPGVLQQLARISEKLETLSATDSRRKTFVAGGIFVAAAVWFLLTEGVHKVLVFLQKL